MAKKSDNKAIADLSLALMDSPKKSAAPVVPGEKKFATKAGWTGNITFGLVTFPAKTYTATDTDKVKFNQLHAACLTQLKQGAMNCPTCDVAVSKDEIVKGYEHEKGKFVTVTEEELEACEPSSSDVMEVLEFVPASQVDPIYFESTDFVAPDKGGEKPFLLLRAGMVARNVIAIAKVTKRGREYTLALRPYGTVGITAHYMFLENEVRGIAKWDDLASISLDAKQVEIAGMLIENLTADFAPETFSDGYLNNARALVASKVAGNEAPKVIKKVALKPTDDLMTALQASVDNSKAKAKRKSA